MSIPVWVGNQYFESATETHYEGYVESRSDVSSESTDWAVGSFLYCGEDGSKWILATSSGTKTWAEMGA